MSMHEIREYNLHAQEHPAKIGQVFIGCYLTARRFADVLDLPINWLQALLSPCTLHSRFSLAQIALPLPATQASLPGVYSI